MASYEIVNLLLGLLMQILELVGCRKLGNIHTIWKDTVGGSLQEMLALVCGDMGDCGENIGRMCSSPLDAISVIDPATPSFLVNVKVL
jgi:hypothetical protein